MSASYDKGRDFERDVASVIRRKIDPTAKRDSKSGALDHRKSDIFTELPISIECKDHETIKIREFFRQAKAGAHVGEMPAAVFPIDNQIVATVPFDALIDLFVEIKDLLAEIDHLREPVQYVPLEQPHDVPHANCRSVITHKPVDASEGVKLANDATAKKVASGGVKTCPNGHIISDGRRCMWKGCKYSSTFNAKKVKKQNGKV